MQLVQSEKMGALGRLVAGIIHEINNPLNFARTGIHVLGTYSKTLPTAEQPDFLEVVKDISDGITRVSAIVGDLRQFGRPDNDALHDVDVAAAAAAALRFMAAEWKEDRAEVMNEIATASPSGGTGTSSCRCSSTCFRTRSTRCGVILRRGRKRVCT